VQLVKPKRPPKCTELRIVANDRIGHDETISKPGNRIAGRHGWNITGLHRLDIAAVEAQSGKHRVIGR